MTRATAVSRNVTPLPSGMRRNIFRGACEVCRTFVPREQGVLVGVAGNYRVRCMGHMHDPVTHVTAPAPATKQAPQRPEISDRAMQAAWALYMHADANGNAEALKLTRELVAACAFARNEPMPDLVPVGDRVDDRPRYQAAAAALVDSILGGPAPEAPAASEAPPEAPAPARARRQAPSSDASSPDAWRKAWARTRSQSK